MAYSSPSTPLKWVSRDVVLEGIIHLRAMVDSRKKTKSSLPDPAVKLNEKSTEKFKTKFNLDALIIRE